jgi:hypothetical protein
MAFTGRVAMQPPQPEHASAAICNCAMPPRQVGTHSPQRVHVS